MWKFEVLFKILSEKGSYSYLIESIKRSYADIFYGRFTYLMNILNDFIQDLI